MDLKERLRAHVGTPFSSPHVDELCTEAADTIAALERKLDFAKEQLWKIERNEDASYSRDLARQTLERISDE